MVVVVILLVLIVLITLILILSGSNRRAEERRNEKVRKEAVKSAKKDMRNKRAESKKAYGEYRDILKEIDEESPEQTSDEEFEEEFEEPTVEEYNTSDSENVENNEEAFELPLDSDEEEKKANEEEDFDITEKSGDELPYLNGDEDEIEDSTDDIKEESELNFETPYKIEDEEEKNKNENPMDGVEFFFDDMYENMKPEPIKEKKEKPKKEIKEAQYIDDELDRYETAKLSYYTLEDVEKALNFTLISEGLLNNEQTYSDAVTLKVKLHAIVISENAKYLTYPNFITVNEYIASLVAVGNHKAQIINFNMEDIDDWFAKVITKIYTKMLFDFTKNLPKRASLPFHVFLEEAHRYVQNDSDKDLIGYNIFERVAKEGRKYGLIFNLISQRPVEISETVISQCTNFIIFKMNHPRDLEYIKKMLPNISAEIVEKQKSLQPGTCVAFGKAFRVPMIIHMEMPNPEPSSSNCDVVDTWAVH